MENGKKPIFPLQQQALLTQQVVTAVTLHLTRNPLRSIEAKETVVQISTRGIIPPVRGWWRSQQSDLNTNIQKNRDVEFIAVGFHFHFGEQRQCWISTLIAFSGRCKQCFQCWIVVVIVIIYLFIFAENKLKHILEVFSFELSSTTTMTRRARIISLFVFYFLIFSVCLNATGPDWAWTKNREWFTWRSASPTDVSCITMQIRREKCW